MKRRIVWQYNGVSTQDSSPFVVDRSVVLTCQFGKGRNSRLDKKSETNTKVSCCYILHVL